MIESIWLQSTTANLHSCVLLFGETISSGVNPLTLRDMVVRDYGASSKFPVYGCSADEFLFNNAEIVGVAPVSLGGVLIGPTNPGGITSKFYTTIEVDADLTYFNAVKSTFRAAIGPGLWVQGYSSDSVSNCQLNVESAIGQIGVVHGDGTVRIRGYQWWQ